MVRARRDILNAVVTASAIGLAGCSASSDSDSNSTTLEPDSGGDDGGLDPIDPDTNPRELLPEAPDGWTVDEPALEQAASMIGAEVGYQRSFTSESGEHYAAGFYRFAEAGDDVEEATELMESWTAYIVRGRFGFAGDGADADKVYLMLGNSSALTEEYARENNELSVDDAGNDTSNLSEEDICTDEGVPRENLSPTTLLPDPPDNWTIEQEPRGVNTTWPADESAYAIYEGPESRNYSLTIGKFDTNEEVVDQVSEDDYHDDVEAATGIFGVQVGGDGDTTPPDLDRATSLAVSVPCVSEDDLYVSMESS